MQNWRKGCVFGHAWKGHDRKIRKKHAKTHLGSILIPGKYMLRVRFESPFTRMISSLKYVSGPLGSKVSDSDLLAINSHKWRYTETNFDVQVGFFFSLKDALHLFSFNVPTI